jgi:hypothetical protein
MRGTAVLGSELHDKREFTDRSSTACTGGFDPRRTLSLTIDPAL